METRFDLDWTVTLAVGFSEISGLDCTGMQCSHWLVASHSTRNRFTGQRVTVMSAAAFPNRAR